MVNVLGLHILFKLSASTLKSCNMEKSMAYLLLVCPQALSSQSKSIEDRKNNVK